MDKFKHLSEKTLLDNFEKIGRWKLDDCENEVCGKISHDIHGGTRLLITCSLTNLSHCKQVLNHVYGTLETGERALLEKCMQRHMQSSKHYLTVEYQVTHMFVGDMQHNDDLKFNRISIPYTSLYTWLAPQPINVEEFDEVEFKGIIRYTPSKDIKIELDDEFTLQVSYGRSRTITAVIKDFTIWQSATVTLISKKGLLAFNELYNKAIYFRNFLMLVTGTSVQPKAIKVAADDTKCVSVFSDHRVYDNIVDEQEFDDLHSNYCQMKNFFEETICDWFKFSEKYSPSLDLYFQAKLKHHTLTLENQFLLMTQALEALHNIKFSSDCKLKVQVKYFLANAHKIEDANIAQGDFIKAVVNNRHYYSHGFLKNKKKHMLTPEKFVKMKLELDLLMYGYIIKELKIPDELKDKIMEEEIKHVQEIRTY